jgi:hypothetical protein
MNYFKRLDYPIFPNIMKELNNLLESGQLTWTGNQICLNTIPNEPNNYSLGTGSLERDWSKSTIIENKIGQTIQVNKKPIIFKESDFTYLCDIFRNTEFEKVYNMLTSKYNVGRIRIMKMDPKNCMSWHKDSTKRVHYVLSTTRGANLVVEDEVKFLELNSWYLVDTTKHHTAFNASMHSRIHLVAVIHD